jgi:hypothetical protein
MTTASRSRWSCASGNLIIEPEPRFPGWIRNGAEIPTKKKLTKPRHEAGPDVRAASQTDNEKPLSQAGIEMDAGGTAPMTHRSAPTQSQMTGATSDLVEEVLGEVLTRLVETLPESAILTILLEVVLLLPLVKRPTPWLKGKRPTLH